MTARKGAKPLKPCPVSGCTAKPRVEWYGAESWAVACMKRDDHHIIVRAATRDAAIKRWDTRAQVKR